MRSFQELPAEITGPVRNHGSVLSPDLPENFLHLLRIFLHRFRVASGREMPYTYHTHTIHIPYTCHTHTIPLSMATIWHHREKAEASPCITTTSYMRELNIYSTWVRRYRSGDGSLFESVALQSLIYCYSLNNPVTDARYSGQLSESSSLIA